MNSALPAHRLPLLDGMRGIAVGLVMCHHLLHGIPGLPEPLQWLSNTGWMGVDLFFVLSGFLIGGILLDHRDSPNYFRVFYIRRAYRILPLYTAILVAAFVFFSICMVFAPQLVTLIGRPMPWWVYGTFTQDVFIANNPLPPPTFFLDITWSLAIEEQFYLTMPAMIRFLPRRTLVVGILALIGGIALARTLMLWDGAVTVRQVYYAPWFRFDGLLIGVLAAVIVRTAQLKQLLAERGWLLYLASVVSGLIALPAMRYIWAPRNHFSATYGFTAIEGFFACVLLMSVVRPGAAAVRWFGWRPLRRLGLIAYGAYLFHDPLRWTSVRTVERIIGAHPSPVLMWGGAIGCFCVAVLLASLSWDHFESRMIARGSRARYQSVDGEGAEARAAESAAQAQPVVPS